MGVAATGGGCKGIRTEFKQADSLSCKRLWGECMVLHADQLHFLTVYKC